MPKRPGTLETLLDEWEYEEPDMEELLELQEGFYPSVRACVLRRARGRDGSSPAILVVLRQALADLPAGTRITLRRDSDTPRQRRAWRWLIPGRTVYAFGIRDYLEEFRPGGEVGIQQLYKGRR